MKKKLFIYTNGYRSVSEGGRIRIAPSSDTPFEEVDMSHAKPDDWQEIKKNPRNDQIVKKIKDELKDKKK